MRYLLSRASRPILARLAQERTLCAFDFDGTLAPIAEHPDQAAMRERTRLLLTQLASLYPCVILSGRTRADLIGKFGGVGIERVIGSHGAETGSLDSTGSETATTHNGGSRAHRRPRLEQWKAAIELHLGGVPGVWIEDKGLSLAVHYRQASRKAEARRRILHATQDLEQARVFGGKAVVNLALAGDPHKGIALAAERDRLGCSHVLFAGDDDNDEEAFAIGGNIVAARVGWKSRTNAGYYLRSQEEIDTLIETLVELRKSFPRPL